MKNPRTSLVSGIVGFVLIGAMILFRSEEPSSTLKMLQYALLGLSGIAIIGALLQMRK